jgi:hypothetical protein
MSQSQSYEENDTDSGNGSEQEEIDENYLYNGRRQTTGNLRPRASFVPQRSFRHDEYELFADDPDLTDSEEEEDEEEEEEEAPPPLPLHRQTAQTLVRRRRRT